MPFVGLLPKAKSPAKSIVVVAGAAVWRQIFQFLHIAAAKNHFVGFERRNQKFYHVRNMLAPLLNAAGFSVTSAASGSEALTVLRDGARVDVIITDIDMPGMDGFELTSAVRRDPRTASLPVIGLSSLVSAELVERGRQVGLHDYVAKFDRQGLIAALKEQTADMYRAA